MYQGGVNMKQTNIFTRMTEIQKTKLEYLAFKENMNVSEYMRYLITLQEANINEESFNKWKDARNEETGEGIKDNERS